MGSSEGALTEQLVDYSLNLKYEDIPSQAVERLKQIYLDHLGVAAGGRALAESTKATLESVRDLVSGAQGRCTVLGESQLYPAHYAALLNAAMAHGMDFDDTHGGAHMHPAAPLIPTLTAIAEEKKASGRQFLTAAIAGYDVGCKLGKAHGDQLHRRRLHPTSTTGIFAVTMAAGSLMGMGRKELLNAVALNLSQTAGSQQFLETGGWNKPFQVGLTAHNAIYSLTFARHGFQGSSRPLEGSFGYFPTYVVDGYDLSLATAGLGEEFEVLQTAIKPYPCCRHNHSAIDGVLEIVGREDIQPEDIQSIEITLSETGYGIVGGPPEVKKRPATIVDAQFSVYFVAAIAALERRYTWQSYQRIQDPQVAGLIDKVGVSPSRELADRATRVVITVNSGEEFSTEIVFPKGEPERPLSWAELESKFRGLWSNGVARASADSIIASVRNIESIEDFSQFTPQLRP